MAVNYLDRVQSETLMSLSLRAEGWLAETGETKKEVKYEVSPVETIQL